MTQGSKIWLWIVAAFQAFGIVSSFVAGVNTATIISIVLSLAIIAGAMLLIFKQMKNGFWLLLAAYVVGIVVNIVNTMTNDTLAQTGAALGMDLSMISIVSGVIGGLLLPLITFLFLKKGWKELK